MIEQTEHASAKVAAAKAALDFVKDGMLVGLGTGSTAALFIKQLILRVKEGLSIRAVATSQASTQQAREGGISILDPTQAEKIDLTIDGADEIDPYKRMIKGGGGALLREKIIATKSERMVVIVDESKCVDFLGKHPLPIEVVAYGWSWTQRQLKKMSYPSSPRYDEKGDLYVTDQGNHILDVSLDHPLAQPEDVHHQLIGVVGVVETGLFYDVADEVIIGHEEGTVRFFT